MAALLQTTAYQTAIGSRPAVEAGSLSDATDRFADAMFRPLRYALRWRRMARLLEQLDDQLLDDVGIARHDIDADSRRVVARNMGARPARGAAFAALVRAARNAAATWMERRAQVHALLRLDDRSLRDIGLTRDMVHAIGLGGRASEAEFASLSYPRGELQHAGASDAEALRLGLDLMDPTRVTPANSDMANDNGLRRAS